MDMYLPIFRHPAAYTKYFIQRVHHVSTFFFLEVKRHRSVPFWRHANLKILSDEDLNEQCANMTVEEDYKDELLDDEEEEEFDDGVETMGGRTFITSMQ
jgi:hypothetical protein